MPSKLTNSFVGLGCFTPILGITLLGYFLYHQSILLGVIAIVASFVVSIILFVLMSQIEEKRKRKQLEFLQTFQPNQADFQKYKSFISYDLLAKIAIDEKRKKAYFWIPDSNKGKKITKAFVGMPYTINTYDFSDLLAIKLKEDGHPITSEQRDTHYTNFFLNKIGEDETKTNPPVDKVSSMDLEVIVNDNVKPRHTIRFYHEPYRRIQKNSPEYKAYYKEVQKWFSLLKVIIHDAEQNVEELNIEWATETIEPSIIEDTFNKSIPEEKTQITIDIDPKKYSLQLSEVSPSPSVEKPENLQDEPSQEKVVEKPTSYFEQLLEKNRRQLRGDYTND